MTTSTLELAPVPAALIDAIDRGDASYGKFQMEFIVAADCAEKLTKAATALGASVHAKDH
jgi:hypothetical protein